MIGAGLASLASSDASGKATATLTATDARIMMGEDRRMVGQRDSERVVRPGSVYVCKVQTSLVSTTMALTKGN